MVSVCIASGFPPTTHPDARSDPKANFIDMFRNIEYIYIESYFRDTCCVSGKSRYHVITWLINLTCRCRDWCNIECMLNMYLSACFNCCQMLCTIVNIVYTWKTDFINALF